MTTKPQGSPSYISGQSGDKAKSAMRVALPQIFAVTVKNVLLMGFGMTLGYPTILIPKLSGKHPDEVISLNQEQISWISSVNLICVPVGCLFSGLVTQPIGRKRAMQFVNIPFLGAWLLFYFSTTPWQVYTALAITGLTGGLLEAPVLTYVAEITQPHLRGLLSATSSVAVILGILIQFLLGTFFHWQTVALICCTIPILAFLLLFLVPESPHWLVVHNRLLDARKAIAWLRGCTKLDDIEPEFKQLCREVGKEHQGIDNPVFEENINGHKIPPATQNKNRTLDYLKAFTKKTFLYPYALVSFSFFLGHFCGMSTLQTYAVQIFASLRAPIDEYYATVILGIFEVLGTIVCSVLVHYTGKRPLTFFSLIGSGICFLTVATYAYLIDVHDLLPRGFKAQNITAMTNATEHGTVGEDTNNYWIPSTFLIASALVSHAGIRVLPWILIGEVYNEETRAVAAGLSGGVGYIFGFLSNKTFLKMIGTMTLPGTYWFYSALSFFGTVVLYFALPETEGKTLHEITDHYAGVKKMNNKVRRKHSYLQRNRDLGKINSGFVPSISAQSPDEDYESRL